MLRYALLRGIRRDLRPHVIQSGATTLADVVKAARIAEVAVGEDGPSDRILGNLLQEVGASRRVAEQNAADIQRLTAKLTTSVSMVDGGSRSKQMSGDVATIMLPRPYF